MREHFRLPKEKALRGGLIAWLVICWLLIDYPYGLLLFVFSVGWPWALRRAQELRGMDLYPGASEIVREVARSQRERGKLGGVRSLDQRVSGIAPLLRRALNGLTERRA